MTSGSSYWRLPEEVETLILSGRCVVFIGSGPSIKCYGSWPDVVNKLSDYCGSSLRVSHDTPTEMLLDAAQNAKDCDEPRYYTFMKTHFGRIPEQRSLWYDVLLSLPFADYLTVNLDPLLALQQRTARIDCDSTIRAYPSLDRKHMNRRSINYLHGLITEHHPLVPDTIIFSRNEFADAYEPTSPLMNFLSPTLANDSIVFIGCTLREPVMRKVFEICKRQQQQRLKVISRQGQGNGTPPQRFIILPEPKMKTTGASTDKKRDIDKQRAYYSELEV